MQFCVRVYGVKRTSVNRRERERERERGRERKETNGAHGGAACACHHTSETSYRISSSPRPPTEKTSSSTWIQKLGWAFIVPPPIISTTAHASLVTTLLLLLFGWLVGSWISCTHIARVFLNAFEASLVLVETGGMEDKIAHLA